MQEPPQEAAEEPKEDAVDDKMEAAMGPHGTSLSPDGQTVCPAMEKLPGNCPSIFHVVIGKWNNVGFNIPFSSGEMDGNGTIWVCILRLGVPCRTKPCMKVRQLWEHQN